MDLRIITEAVHEELDHACLIGSFLVLLFLVMNALCNACHDGYASDDAAEEDSEAEPRHIHYVREWRSDGAR